MHQLVFTEAGFVTGLFDCLNHTAEESAQQFDYFVEHLTSRQLLQDSYGYPTDSFISLIENFDAFKRCSSLMQLIEENWAVVPWVATANGTQTEFAVHTGGWSGNEQLIRAMKSNSDLWKEVFVSEQVGGHYVFRTNVDKV